MENQTPIQNQVTDQPQAQPPIQQPQAPDPKPKKPWYKKWWVWVIVAIVIMGVIGSQMDKEKTGDTSSTTSSETSPKKEEEKKEDTAESKAEEKEETPAEEPEESKEDFIKSCEEIDYKTLARNPDSHKGENMKFTGQVIQVSDSNSIFSSGTTLRINVTAEENEFAEGGYLWSDTILANVEIPDGADRILENDIIDIYGVCDGLYTYKTVLGDNKSLPLINVKYYNIHMN